MKFLRVLFLVHIAASSICIGEDDPLGVKYRGIVSKTRDGRYGVRRCVRWNVWTLVLNTVFYDYILIGTTYKDTPARRN